MDLTLFVISCKFGHYRFTMLQLLSLISEFFIPIAIINDNIIIHNCSNAKYTNTTRMLNVSIYGIWMNSQVFVTKVVVKFFVESVTNVLL